ncbi:MAG: hypothetical protein KAX31_02705 [Thermoplasmata archaeon]|nr:hypothetical protein [Thermoplasmata archaeon]
MIRRRLPVIALGILIVFSGVDFLAFGLVQNVGSSQDGEVLPASFDLGDRPMQPTGRVVLVEEFTSWNSIPCAAYNPYMYAAIENYGYDKVAPGFIHVWWPPPVNDPFYLSTLGDSVARVNFYDNASAPDTYIDGVDYPQYPSQAQIESYFENQLDESPRVDIETKGTLDPIGLTGSVSAYVEALTPLAGTDYRLMCYLWENNVTRYGGGDNNETEFKWAVWEMLPDANGTWVNLTSPGDFAVVTQNFTLDPTWDANQLGVSVFVQDFNTRRVEQAHVEEFENPYVELLTPEPLTPGQVFTGTIVIDWRATDIQDNDTTLDITIEYSPDAGNSWFVITSGIDNNSPPYLWDTIEAGVPDGANYMLRVIATDSEGRTSSGMLGQTLERFSIDNTGNDLWYLQVQSSNLPPNLDLDMKPFESSVQETMMAVPSPGNLSVQTWASEYVAPSDVDLVGDWAFSIFARVTWDRAGGNLYANVYGDNGTGRRLLFTTGLDDENVSAFKTYHEFYWIHSVPNGTFLNAGEHVVVEIMLGATSGSIPGSHWHYAESDIPVMVNLTNDYTFTFVSDQQREILDEISSANGSIAMVINESFAGGISPDWTLINKGGGGGTTKSWTTANPANRSAAPPVQEPFVIVDSAAHGPLEMDEQLITPPKDLSFATAVTLEFDQVYLDDPNQSEMSQVDIRSTLTGGAWVNVLDQSGNSSGDPDHVILNLTTWAAGGDNVEIRFYYFNAYNASYWIVDNVLIQGYIHSSMLEHKWTFNLTANEPPYEFHVEAGRSISSDWDDFIFSYSLDDDNYTFMALVDLPAEKDFNYTLPLNCAGTIYIRAVDTDRTSGNTDVSRLVVDMMDIRTGPPRLIIGFDHYTTPSFVAPAFTYNLITHLCIMDAPGGAGANVTDHNMTTDDTLTVWAASFDSEWNYVTDVLCNWTNTLNAQTASWSTSFTLDPTGPGNGTITANFGVMMLDTTGLITVLPGAVVYLCIQDAPGGAGTNITIHLMTADQTLTLYAVAYDAEWNVIGEANCTWLTTGTLDIQTTIGTNFTFDPVTAPSSGTIIAVSVITSNLTDSTGTITVIPGALANLCILDQPGGSSIPGVNVTNHTMTVGDTLVLWSVGFDADWNYLLNVQANWSNTITTQTANYSQTFIFAPRTPGSGFVFAEFNSTINDTTGLIVVLPGALNRMFTRDAPGGMGNIVCGHSMTTDETLTVWAAGYDEYGNYLGDIDCNWSTTGTLDDHTATGVNNITFDPWTAGTNGFITGVWGNISGSAGEIIVVPGALDRVIVKNMPGGEGSEVMDVVLILGQEMTVYSAGYDAEGNYIGDVLCNWTTTGTLNLTTAMMASSFTFRPAAAGENGTILGVFNTTIQDETGIITVIDHAIDYIKIEDGSGVEITTHTMDVTETLVAYAIAYNNSVGRIGPFNVNWTTTGTLDIHNATLSQSLTFVPTHAPTSGTFEASLGTLFDTTETITVNLGSLAHICIQDISGGMGTNVTTHTMTTDQTLTVHAVGYDATWNYLSSIVVNWSNTLNAQTASDAKQFTFNPLTPGTGIIIAEFNATVSDTTGLITVVPGSLAHIILRDSPGNMGNQVGAVSMTTDDTLTVWSAGYDAEWNYMGDVNCRWFTDQTLDDQTAEDVNSFTFDPVTANTQGHILAMNISIFGVNPTGLITVGFGALHQIIIRDAPGGGGMEVNYRMLLPGQSLTLYSAGYDADGNFIADIPCNWTTTGTLNLTTASISPSFTFTPANTGESGNITANFNATVHDETGLIYVPDYGIDYIMITNNMGVEITTHTMDTSETFKVWAIGYNDSIGAIGLVSVDWTTTGSLDLQTENISWAFTFDPVHAPTSGTIEASLVTMSDSTGIITVNPGPITHLCIQDAPGSGGNNITSHFMTTSETLTLWAVGYDAEWNYASEALSLWSTTGTLDPQTGLSTSFTFDPATAPTQGTITAFDAASGQWGETGNITVVYPPLAYICIQDSPGGLGANVTTHTMTTDETFTVWAIGFDAGWNYVYDTADAVDTIMTQGRVAEIYHIPPIAYKSVDEVNDTILRLTRKHDLFEGYKGKRLKDDYRYALDTSKMEEELGWTPQIDWEEGMKLTIDWYTEHRELWK